MAKRKKKDENEIALEEAMGALPESFRDLDFSDKSDGLSAGVADIEKEPEEEETDIEPEPKTGVEEPDDEAPGDGEKEEEEESGEESDENAPEEKKDDDDEAEESEDDSQEEDGKSDEGTSKPADEEHPLLMELNYRGQKVEVPDTPEGREHLRSLAQQGFGAVQKLHAMKPWENVINFLWENQHVRNVVERYMSGELQPGMNPESGAQADGDNAQNVSPDAHGDFSPTAIREDETTEEYAARVAKEAIGYARNNLLPQYQETVATRERSQKVREAVQNDKLYQPTAQMMQQSIEQKHMPNEIMSLADKSPDAFAYLYGLHRQIAMTSAVFNELKRRGVVTEEMLKGGAPKPQPQQKPGSGLPKEKPPHTEQAKAGKKNNAKSSAKIDWTDPSFIQGKSLEEIRNLSQKFRN